MMPRADRAKEGVEKAKLRHAGQSLGNGGLGLVQRQALTVKLLVGRADGADGPGV